MQTMAEREEKISALRVDSRSVEELYLNFTLPGFSDWELKVLPLCSALCSLLPFTGSSHKSI